MPARNRYHLCFKTGPVDDGTVGYQLILIDLETGENLINMTTVEANDKPIELEDVLTTSVDRYSRFPTPWRS